MFSLAGAAALGFIVGSAVRALWKAIAMTLLSAVVLAFAAALVPLLWSTLPAAAAGQVAGEAAALGLLLNPPLALLGMVFGRRKAKRGYSV